MTLSEAHGEAMRGHGRWLRSSRTHQDTMRVAVSLITRYTNLRIEVGINKEQSPSCLLSFIITLL